MRTAKCCVRTARRHNSYSARCAYVTVGAAACAGVTLGAGAGVDAGPGYGCGLGSGSGSPSGHTYTSASYQKRLLNSVVLLLRDHAYMAAFGPRMVQRYIDAVQAWWDHDVEHPEATTLTVEAWRKYSRGCDEKFVEAVDLIIAYVCRRTSVTRRLRCSEVTDVLSHRVCCCTHTHYPPFSYSTVTRTTTSFPVCLARWSHCIAPRSRPEARHPAPPSRHCVSSAQRQLGEPHADACQTAHGDR